MSRDSIKVALNAITDLTPVNGSRVYLLGLAEALGNVPGICLEMLVAKGQSNQLPQALRHFAKEIDIPPRRSYWQGLFQWRIDNYLKRNKIDIYHVPNTSPLLPKDTKTIITIHDLADVRIPKYSKARTVYRRLVNHAAARSADCVLTVSNNSKRDIIELLHVQAEKVRVVYPGVGAGFRTLNRETCRRELSTKHGLVDKYVFAPGGLARNKNVNGLLTAFAELIRQGLCYQLVFSGEVDPNELRSIRSIVDKLGLGGRVLFTGHVPSEEMPKFYNAACAVAYVSLYEGFGLPLLESMACGTPMVVSDCSSIPEVVDDAALRVNPYDTGAIASSLRELLCNSELHMKLSARGLDRVSAFSWAQTAYQTAETYFQIAGGEEQRSGSIPTPAHLSAGVNTRSIQG